ncbi:hypothetical protein ARMGADRAFT_1032190 [Armillaria gallica]|uniref:Uncharacterized protein n=1 Tax=Armillaria gallica TaxID=47427 RepID=A0A2H3DNI6_ARMGA|nr:hypothetical protein ARMGADRAFT_1032190 [Armillaria gallica]
MASLRFAQRCALSEAWRRSYFWFCVQCVSIKLLPVILANRRIVIAELISECSLDFPFDTLLKYTSQTKSPGRGGDSHWTVKPGVPMVFHQTTNISMVYAPFMCKDHPFSDKHMAARSGGLVRLEVFF